MSSLCVNEPLSILLSVVRQIKPQTSRRVSVRPILDGSGGGLEGGRFGSLGGIS